MDIGLYYYNARYYAPYLNRFFSPDTLIPDPANPQAFNRYSYVENRPLNFNDPTGHCAEGQWGDDYEDVGCLEIAQSIAYKYDWSFSDMAKLNWMLGTPVPIDNPLFLDDENLVVEGGNEIIGYEILETRGRRALVDNANVYQINYGDNKTQFRALIKQEGEASAVLSDFKNYANNHASAEEDFYIHRDSLIIGGGMLASGTFLTLAGLIPEPATPVLMYVGLVDAAAGASLLFTQGDELYNDYRGIYSNSINAQDAFFNLTTPGTLYSDSTLAVDLDGD